MATVVLASASPRRRDLLAAVGFDLEVVPADLDESRHDGESPEVYVARLARAKAVSVARHHHGAVVLGADTTVDLDGEILSKPHDPSEARAMLKRLSARTHRVHTAVAAVREDQILDALVTTLVTFVPVTDEMLEWYLSTGEPFDKAGGYGIQGAGGVLVDQVRGSVSNVVGLPLAETVSLLGRLGLVPGSVSAPTRRSYL
jgi:septum formation protein